MIARTTVYSVRGGDTTQIIETARQLKKLGILIEIKLANEIIAYDNFDLIHFFNITRPADILFHVRKSGKPFVVSTILINYSEYDKQHRTGIAGALLRFLSTDGAEYLKTISRWIIGRDKLVSFSFIWKGQQRVIIEILKRASLVLPNSLSEYERLKQQYDCTPRYIVVPNGIDPDLFTFDPTIKKDPNLVLCVARIEGIKNQLNLIKALNSTNYKLLLIGTFAPNQGGYFQSCKEKAAANIQFIGQLSQKELIQYYQMAKVHVLPSWFESTGLSSLEAAAMGCNIVITEKGDAKEYFGNDAFYCDSGIPESIYKAVELAASVRTNTSLQNKVLSQFTWQQAAIKTIAAYKEVLKQ